MRAPNIAGKSTLKSTNYLPSPSVSETYGTTVKKINHESKVPFKLVPVIPPKKNGAIDVTTTSANTRNIINSTPKKISGRKSKVKSVMQRRALSPVIEYLPSRDSVPSHSTNNTPINNERMQQTSIDSTSKLTSEQTTDFEMIDELDIPVLMELTEYID